MNRNIQAIILCLSLFALAIQPIKAEAVTASAEEAEDAVIEDRDLDTVEDSADNCPDQSNKDQEDFDADSIGDACEDSDADGILDALEVTYLALDPLNAQDANLDYDGDGVSNYSELVSGFNPDVADVFPARDVLKHFPLGNIEWKYVGPTYETLDEDEEEVEVSDSFSVFSRLTTTIGRFKLINPYGYDIFERRADGIYHMEVSTRSNRGVLKLVFPSGILWLPNQMSLGQTVAASGSGEYYIDEELIGPIDLQTNLLLLEEPKMPLKDATVSALSMVTERRTFYPDGTEGLTANIDILGENTGPMRRNGPDNREENNLGEDAGILPELGQITLTSFELESVRIGRLDNSLVGDQPVAREKAVYPVNQSGAGSSSWLFLLMLTGFVSLRVIGRR